jgi:iron(III) transport system substrate-binding protein
MKRDATGGDMRAQLRRGPALMTSVAASILITANAASAQSFTPAMQKVIDGVKTEGVLTLSYGSALDGATGAGKLQDRINRKFGVNLKFNFTPAPSGPEMASRIAQEIAANRPSSTDIFFTSMTSENARYFEPIEWRELLPDLPQEALKYGNRGVAFATLLIGVTYNSAIVPPEQAPTSLFDLLKPEWKGKLAARVSTTFMSYLALPEVLGPKGAVDFFREFGARADGQMRCGSWERIVSGEFPIFFPDCGDYEARKALRLGAPIGHIIPREAGGMAFWPLGIPRNSAHPNAARLFIAYLLGREGQDFLWETDATDYHLLPGSHLAPEIEKYRTRGIRFFDQIDVETNHPETLKTQQEMFQAMQSAMQK